MTGIGPSGQQPQESRDGAGPAAAGATVAPASSADRASRLNAANMLRSLLPLLVIVLLIVGWQAFKDDGVNPVHAIDPTSTVRLAADRAGYHVLVPTGLPGGYRPTSARTDAADAKQGDSVTLQIGYVTPSQEYAGFAESDDPRADALTSVLSGARRRGSVPIDGRSWARSTTERGETALTLTTGGVTVVVTGSASEKELETVAGAVRAYSG